MILWLKKAGAMSEVRVKVKDDSNFLVFLGGSER